MDDQGHLNRLVTSVTQSDVLFVLVHYQLLQDKDLDRRSTADSRSRTPLQAAAEVSWSRKARLILEILLHGGSNPGDEGWRGASALELARECGNVGAEEVMMNWREGGMEEAEEAKKLLGMIPAEAERWLRENHLGEGEGTPPPVDVNMGTNDYEGDDFFPSEDEDTKDFTLDPDHQMEEEERPAELDTQNGTEATHLSPNMPALPTNRPSSTATTQSGLAPPDTAAPRIAPPSITSRSPSTDDVATEPLDIPLGASLDFDSSPPSIRSGTIEIRDLPKSVDASAIVTLVQSSLKSFPSLTITRSIPRLVSKGHFEVNVVGRWRADDLDKWVKMELDGLPYTPSFVIRARVIRRMEGDSWPEYQPAIDAVVPPPEPHHLASSKARRSPPAPLPPLSTSPANISNLSPPPSSIPPDVDPTRRYIVIMNLPTTLDDQAIQKLIHIASPHTDASRFETKPRRSPTGNHKLMVKFAMPRKRDSDQEIADTLSRIRKMSPTKDDAMLFAQEVEVRNLDRIFYNRAPSPHPKASSAASSPVIDSIVVATETPLVQPRHKLGSSDPPPRPDALAPPPTNRSFSPAPRSPDTDPTRRYIVLSALPANFSHYQIISLLNDLHHAIDTSLYETGVRVDVGATIRRRLLKFTVPRERESDRDVQEMLSRARRVNVDSTPVKLLAVEVRAQDLERTFYRPISKKTARKSSAREPVAPSRPSVAQTDPDKEMTSFVPTNDRPRDYSQSPPSPPHPAATERVQSRSPPLGLERTNSEQLFNFESRRGGGRNRDSAPPSRSRQGRSRSRSSRSRSPERRLPGRRESSSDLPLSRDFEDELLARGLRCQLPLATPATPMSIREWVKESWRDRIPATFPGTPAELMHNVVVRDRGWRTAMCLRFPPTIHPNPLTCRGRTCDFAHSKAELRMFNGELKYPRLSESRIEMRLPSESERATAQRVTPTPSKSPNQTPSPPTRASAIVAAPNLVVETSSGTTRVDQARKTEAGFETSAIMNAIGTQRKSEDSLDAAIEETVPVEEDLTELEEGQLLSKTNSVATWTAMDVEESQPPAIDAEELHTPPEPRSPSLAAERSIKSESLDESGQLDDNVDDLEGAARHYEQMAKDMRQLASLDLSQRDIATIRRVWEPISKPPFASFSRTIQISVDFGHVTPVVARQALSSPNPYPKDSPLHHLYKQYLEAQTGENREWYLGILAQLSDFNDMSVEFSRVASSATRETSRKREELGGNQGGEGNQSLGPEVSLLSRMEGIVSTAYPSGAESDLPLGRRLGSHSIV